MKKTPTRLVIVQVADMPDAPPRFWGKLGSSGGTWTEQLDHANVYHRGGHAEGVATRIGGVVHPYARYELPPLRDLLRPMLSARLTVTQRRTLAADLRALADEQDMLADGDIRAGAHESFRDD